LLINQHYEFTIIRLYNIITADRNETKKCCVCCFEQHFI